MLSYSSIFIVAFVVCLSWVRTPAASNVFTRKVELSHNPGCNIEECNNDTSVNLIYARAQGRNDTLHYILSTVGPSSPTILLLRTKNIYATLKVNWTSFVRKSPKSLSGSVTLVSEKKETVKSNVESVIIINKILEYNDSMDTAVYNRSTQITPSILLNQLQWNVSLSTSNDTYMLLGTDSNNSTSFSPNSTIAINFTPHGCQGRSTVLPSLPYSANSSGWEIYLDSLLSRRVGSRFAIEALLLGTQAKITKTKYKSIDDEYAPAAFTTAEVKWYGANTGAKGIPKTYQKWRAVAYTAKAHTRPTETDVTTNNLTLLNASSLYREVSGNRLLMGYFGAQTVKEMEGNSVILSFGQPGDDFYAASNYTSWSFDVGFSKPATDQFSTLVLCMLFIGIGCPLLVFVFGAIYVIYVKTKRYRNGIKNTVLVTNYDYVPIEE